MHLYDFSNFNLKNVTFSLKLLMSACLQASTVNITVGSHVWVEDPQLAWINGEIVKIDGQNVHVNTTNGKKVL